MLPVFPMRLKNFLEHWANYCSAKIDVDNRIVCRFSLRIRVKGM